MVKRTAAASLIILILVIFGGRFYFTYKLDGHILYAEYAVCLLVTIGVLLYGLITEQVQFKKEGFAEKEFMNLPLSNKITLSVSIIMILVSINSIYLELKFPLPDIEGFEIPPKRKWFNILIRIYVLIVAALTAIRSYLVLQRHSRASKQKENNKEDADHL